MKESTSPPVSSLGIDAGTSTVKAVFRDSTGTSHTLGIIPTGGQPIITIAHLLLQAAQSYSLSRVLLGLTGTASVTAAELLGLAPTKEPTALSRAVQVLYPDTRWLLSMGGSGQILIPYREREGQLVMGVPRLSGRCAAGGGSFIESMLARLDYVDLAEFISDALEPIDPDTGEPTLPVTLSGRCAVFTESDIVHLRQKGTQRSRIAAGLHQAIARNTVNRLVGKTKLDERVLFVGGLSENAAIGRYLETILHEESLFGGLLYVPDENRTLGAIGASLLADHAVDLEEASRLLLSRAGEHQTHLTTVPLRLRTILKHDQAEAPVPKTLKLAAIGCDIGSVSTKVAVIAEVEGKIRLLAWHYRRTGGNPVEAMKDCFAHVHRSLDDQGYMIERFIVATTGSGRYLTGDLFGANEVYDEMSAQERGARVFTTDIRTLMEIGGQDSKVIRINSDGSFDPYMNKACAAGTGAFIERIAEELGLTLQEFIDHACRSEAPAVIDSTCTVYTKKMALDLKSEGVPIEDICAGICLASVENFLKNLPADFRIEAPVVFQGATAFNRALIAAFETVLGIEIIVPEHPDITGAVGAAALLLEDNPTDNRFGGFEALETLTYQTQSFECTHCPNRCDVNVFQRTADGQPSGPKFYYNDRCERYSGKQKREKAKHAFPDLFAEYEAALTAPTGIELPENAPTIGIPRGGMFNLYYPLWRAFFEGLGFRVITPGPANARIASLGVNAAIGEPCYPSKVFIGMTEETIRMGAERVFLAQVCDSELLPNMTEAQTCPFVQARADVDLATLNLAARGVKTIVGTFHMRLGERYLQHSFTEVARQLGKSPRESRHALKQALAFQRRFRAKILSRGREVLAGLGPEETAIVVLGRPYILYDPVLNMDIGKKIRNEGHLPIPRDFLPIEDIDISGDWGEVYSRQVQNHLAAAEIVRRNPHLRALIITYFACSPDAFCVPFTQQSLNERVSVIELDEHSADAGVLTRLESYLRSLRRGAPKGTKVGGPPRCLGLSEVGTRTVYIPPLTRGAELLGALFRDCGIDARMIAPIKDQGLVAARRAIGQNVCLPMLVTTQYYLETAQTPGFNPATTAFFQATSQGPCRLGYYQMMDWLILDRLGLGETRMVTIGNKTGAGLGVDLPTALMGYSLLLAHTTLHEMLLRVRPYAVKPDFADAVFNRHINLLMRAIPRLREQMRQSAGELLRPKHLVDMLPFVADAAVDFLGLLPDEFTPRPVVGLIGEFFVRLDEFSNQSLIKRLEQLGVEVRLAPMTEFFDYTVEIARQVAGDRFWHNGLQWSDTREYILRSIYGQLIRRSASRLHHAAGWLLHDRKDARPGTVIANATPYVHKHFGGEVTASFGTAVDYAEGGASGIVFAGPSGCGPSIISGEISPLFASDYDVPVLHLDFNGFRFQAEALEYFVESILAEHNRKTHGPITVPRR